MTVLSIMSVGFTRFLICVNPCLPSRVEWVKHTDRTDRTVITLAWLALPGGQPRDTRVARAPARDPGLSGRRWRWFRLVCAGTPESVPSAPARA